MNLFVKMCNQTRKPEGFLGKLMVETMNSGHSVMADWGMSVLDNISAKHIAELGCGGGRNARELLKRYPGSELTALDYSDISVEKTLKTNRKTVASGRCTVVRGDVSSLPFDEGSFDLATAFETVYFWPGLNECFAEVYRILSPGGYFLICNESDGTDEVTLKYEKIIDGMSCYRVDQLTEALHAAGFTVAETRHHPSRPWIAILARKEDRS